MKGKKILNILKIISLSTCAMYVAISPAYFTTSSSLIFFVKKRLAVIIILSLFLYLNFTPWYISLPESFSSSKNLSLFFIENSWWSSSAKKNTTFGSNLTFTSPS